MRRGASELAEISTTVQEPTRDWPDRPSFALPRREHDADATPKSTTTSVNVPIAVSSERPYQQPLLSSGTQESTAEPSTRCDSPGAGADQVRTVSNEHNPACQIKDPAALVDAIRFSANAALQANTDHDSNGESFLSAMALFTDKGDPVYKHNGSVDDFVERALMQLMEQELKRGQTTIQEVNLFLSHLNQHVSGLARHPEFVHAVIKAIVASRKNVPADAVSPVVLLQLLNSFVQHGFYVSHDHEGASALRFTSRQSCH